MTTGSRSDGTYDGTYYNNYAQRIWYGGDAVRPPRVIEVIDVSHENSYLRVRKGKRSIVVKYKKRFLRRRLRPPRRVRKGEEHPYNMSYKKVHAPRLLHYIDYFNGGILQPLYPNSWGYGNSTAAFTWDNNDQLALIGKLREKVAGSDFNAGVFLAQSHEALTMITGTARKIYGAYFAARRGQFWLAHKILTVGTDRFSSARPKVVASNWLELQYGWLPLLKDCESAAQFLAHELSYPMQWTVTVRSSKKLGTLRTASPSNSDFKKKEVWTRCQIKAKLTEKDVAQLSGLLDPFSVAWELLPYSFVLDWFIPIGNYLAARGLSQSLTGTFVVTRTDYAEGHGQVSVDPTHVIYENCDDFAFKQISLTRTVTNVLDVPPPAVKDFRKIASWKHCANALALVTQKIKL